MRKRTILLTDRELELIQVALFRTSIVETKEKLYSKLSRRLDRLWFESLSKSEIKKIKEAEARRKKKRIEEPEDELQALNTISVKTEDKYEKKEDE